MKTSVEITNQEVTLASINNDSQTAANHLAELYEEAREVRAEVANVRQVILTEKELAKTEQDQLKEQKTNWEGGIAKRQKEIDVLSEQRKRAMGDLKNLNEWIFSAQTDHERRQGELGDIQKKIGNHSVLLERTFALQNEIAELEEMRKVAEARYSVERESALATLRDIQQQQMRAQELCDKALESTLEAENQRQKTIQEKERIRKDLEIYTRRVENQYEQAFPGLHAKL